MNEVVKNKRIRAIPYIYAWADATTPVVDSELVVTLTICLLNLAAMSGHQHCATILHNRACFAIKLGRGPGLVRCTLTTNLHKIIAVLKVDSIGNILDSTISVKIHQGLRAAEAPQRRAEVGIRRLAHTGFTQSSDKPVSSWTCTDCGGYQS